MHINTIRLKNRILQLMYRPGKGDIFNSKSLKTIDEMNKLLEDGLPGIGRRKRGKDGGDDKKADTDEE